MSDRSNAVNAWVNKNIMPIAEKIGAFKPLIAIRDGNCNGYATDHCRLIIYGY